MLASMRSGKLARLFLNLVSVFCLIELLYFLMIMTINQPAYDNWNADLKNEIIALEDRMSRKEVLKVEKVEEGKVGREYLENMLKIPDHMDAKTRRLKDIHDFIYETLDKLQNEGDCEEKKIVQCHNSVMSGFGSTIHRHVICLHIAFALGRAFFIEHDYSSFNGLAAFTRMESGKCAYLKNKIPEIKSKCNFKDPKCYLNKDNFEIDNSYKVLEFTHEANFPAPKYIPGTLPKNMEKELYDLGVKEPWHWFTSQLLGYMILRPNHEFKEKLAQSLDVIQFQKPVISMHVRRGDKIGSESHFIDESTFVKAALAKSNHTYADLYVASGEKSAIMKIKKMVTGKFRVRQSPANKLSSILVKRDDKSKNTMENILFDLYMLAHADHSIVTFSSNVGRLVWELKTAMYPYDAKDTVVSLDSRLFYGWYDYHARQTYYLSTKENKASYPVGKDSIVMEYNVGELFLHHHKRRVTDDHGKFVNLSLVTSRSNHKSKGYVLSDDFTEWPGKPHYKNDIA
uniref:Fucosyl_transferase n=1 Tax=Hydractinia symbiolongicarpus TaxID=13093 RepID=E5EWB0_HYDSY|nr:fucosyl_transferase [Hydractinia symbiolongicarpus]